MTHDELETVVKDLISDKSFIRDEELVYAKGIVDLAEELKGRGYVLIET